VTHDPVHTMHTDFLPFPRSGHFYTQDKLADWLEAYATIMELNVRMKTAIKSADCDEKSNTWTVVLARTDGSLRTLHPRHLVWATGTAGALATHR
jgi:cation diffusion facilitator CzcD-associated flavoprotein CzcO